MLRQATITLATAILLAGFAGPTSARADEEPQILVAKDDLFKMYAGVALYRLEVYENDPAFEEFDRTGVHKQLDRAPGVTKKEVRVDGNVIVLKLDPRRTKDVVFRYRLFDLDTGALSNWATTTIDITKNIPLKFRSLGDGKLKVINKNAARADCVWWKAGDWRVLGQGPVKAKGARVLKLKVPAIKITCTIGKKYWAVNTDRRVKVRL